MRVRTLAALAAAVVVGGVAASAQTPALKVLDPAPAIKVAKWVKGSEVSSFAAGKTYVVEFWATWCGPCKTTIPHLTEMAKKLAGKVTFVGVSVWERQANDADTAYMEKVDQFVKEMGDKMDYNVAVDGPEKTMAKTWMTAAGQNGIPSAFVVDGTGKIAWIGHPMDGLDKVLDQVLAGTFNPTAAAAEREKREAAERKQSQVMAPMMAALNKQDYKGAVVAIDKIIAENPDMKQNLSMTKFMVLMRSDEKAMYAFAKQLSTGLFSSDAQMLNQLAWPMVDEQSPLKTRNYPLALSIAKRAAQVSKNGDPMILDTLAVAYFKSGNKAQAISTQTQAVALLKKPGASYPPEMAKELEAKLKEWKR